MFQNFGLVAVLVILVSEYLQEKELENDKIISMLAMVYFVFFSVNVLFYFGLSATQTFLANLIRLATIFEMEEYKSTRQTIVERSKVELTQK